MRLSAVVPAYNCEAYLERAIRSLLETDVPGLEIVVVDDGSRDGTWEVAKRIEEASPGRVAVYTHPGRMNRGVSASRNLGIERSNGQLICFLDADDYVYPHRFESALSILQEYPDVDGVFQTAEVIFEDENAKTLWWNGPRVFGLTNYNPSDQLLFTLLAGHTFPVSGIVFRRALLKMTGVFDERLHIAEDCHLWMRMACAGRLVAGDLSRPVSAYWRRRGSAYQATQWNNTYLIQAMRMFLNWMRRERPSDARLLEVRRRIVRYILDQIADARASNDWRLAWSLTRKAVVWFPEIISNRRFLGNVARMAMGR